MFILSWLVCCAVRFHCALSLDMRWETAVNSLRFYEMYFCTQYRYATYAAGVVAGIAIAGAGVEKHTTESASDSKRGCCQTCLIAVKMIIAIGIIALALLNGADDNIFFRDTTTFDHLRPIFLL